MAGPYLSQTQQQRLQMVLAPQLRQSLELLQVPVLELRSLIQQELEQNPTLEEKIPDSERIEVEPAAAEPEPMVDSGMDEQVAALAALDEEWRQYFQQNRAAHTYNKDDEARRQYFLDSISQAESLQEHLLRQLSLAGLPEEDVRLGELIIGNINDDGYLSIILEELAATTGYPAERLRDVLSVIQEFDPIGVGARDLKECLLMQLDRLGKSGSVEAALVRDHLDELGAKKYAQIAKAMKIPVEDVQRHAHIIAMLEPKPGRRFASDSAPYVTPEVVIQKVDDRYIIALNNEQIPHLRISKQYRAMLEDPNTSVEARNYIQDKIRAGAFLIKSIHQRQQTIRNIAHEILRVQQDFFDHGIAHLKPLTMAEVAEVIGIHETTVSRAIANKYIQTPQGSFEMKYFFTPGYKTADGQEVSNKTIKDAIAQIIAREDTTAPLSDQAIANILKERGTQVARRTVTKYREELKILPSHMRRSF